MEQNKNIQGHILAFITIFIWGTTYISTKVLLRDFLPIEILLIRFVLGFVILFLVYPHKLKLTDKKQELMFAAAGLCGVTLYYLLENIALVYTRASNVGVIVAVSPCFIAILAHFCLEKEELKLRFFAGFIIAMVGIIFITFNGATTFAINPLGDLLALLSAVVWAIYSILTRKICQYGYHTVATTRHIFFYGIIFMLPTLFFFDFKMDLERFTNITNILNLLFLGLMASALCFVTWSLAVKFLGAIKTSVYIYTVPVITVVTSVIVLHERITVVSSVGILLTLLGLMISESRMKFHKQDEKESLISE
jgi:drug/metabolite transporter (DMT)-like permease